MLRWHSPESKAAFVLAGKKIDDRGVSTDANERHCLTTRKLFRPHIELYLHCSDGPLQMVQKGRMASEFGLISDSY
jgi:hypothetical protein